LFHFFADIYSGNVNAGRYACQSGQKRVSRLDPKVSVFRLQHFKNFKYQITNTKWFDKPFDRLTVLSKVEGLTTLSQVEGQITMTEIQNLALLRSLNIGI